MFEIDRIDLIVAACGEVAGRDVRDAVRRRLADAITAKFHRAFEFTKDTAERFLLLGAGLGERDLESLALELSDLVAGAAICRPWGEVFVTLSAGGAVSHVRAVNHKVMSLWAASALDEGRRRGSRQVKIVQAPNSLADWYRGAIAILGDVRRAVDAGRVELAFQPVVGAGGEVFYYEGLIRLMDERGIRLMPSEFIPPLEQLGMMGWLDHFVFEKVLGELRDDETAILGCNISGQSICDRRWMQYVLRTLKAEPQVARRLVIEVTETAAIFDLIKAAEHITKLRDLGCRVALDDFGAGFASFSHLATLGVDIVKIDQGFLGSGTAQRDWLKQISYLAGLANGLGVDVVVEGVEDDAHLQVLALANVSHVQGYRFGYPAAYRRWRQNRGPFNADLQALSLLSEVRGGE